MALAHWSRLTRVALTASRIAISVGGTGWAKSVQVFDTAPSLEVLRRIMARVEGHTDATGSAGYNNALSKQPGLPVGEYPVKLGIDPSRLVLVGKGTPDPLVKDRMTARTIARNSLGSDET